MQPRGRAILATVCITLCVFVIACVARCTVAECSGSAAQAAVESGHCHKHKAPPVGKAAHQTCPQLALSVGTWQVAGTFDLQVEQAALPVSDRNLLLHSVAVQAVEADATPPPLTPAHSVSVLRI